MKNAANTTHNDPVFQAEQDHLSETHAKLRSIEAELTEQIQGLLGQAREDKSNMLDELATDFVGDVNLETFVEMQAVQEIIDQYNLSADIQLRRLSDAQRLLKQPYFAKVSLLFSKGKPARDLYIGTVGMTDNERRHFIIDWRSPVAEVYYNQANGPTSYQADGRTIHVDLKLRRQFDIEGAQLNSYFDTTVAIQDQLLLESLAKNRTAHLQAITTTIQKEQNTVIRHEDVPALLVSGVAGSGKTSVLLQRIAYLFYRERDNLRPQDVYLVSPNDVFARYIANVLPDMGEANPQTVTWDSLMQRLGLGDRGLGADADAETLHAIENQFSSITFDSRDFNDIKVGDEKVITAGRVRGVVEKFLRTAKPGVRLAALVEDELVDKVYARAQSRSTNEEVQDEVYELSADDQHRIFGEQVVATDEREMAAYTFAYLKDRYQAAIDAIRDGQWMRIDRIGMRLLDKEHLTSAEYLYLKMALTGVCCREARYVMVDEVQDYTVAQLMVLARYFPNAHFLLLGDPNQAIAEGTASWDSIRTVFSRMRNSLSECELTTSYRSTPQITELFAGLMEQGSGMQAQSVQREGEPPSIVECTTHEEYLDAIRTALSAAQAATDQDGGLAALIAPDGYRCRKLAEALEEVAPPILQAGDTLPEQGLVMLSLKHAKGLEFDHVIIAEAQADTYDASDLSRRRLYTACSRATKHLCIIAQGSLTPLLG